MDPVSHVIFARTIVAAIDTPDRARFGRGSGLTACLAGLAPDIDCVLMPFGWDIYLRVHEIGTHSLAGAAVLGCAAAALVHRFARGSRLRALAAAGVSGAISHLALDVLSGARLGLLWPFTEARTTLPLVAMAEPWLVALLAIGAMAMWLRRGQMTRTARAVLVAVLAFFCVKGVLYAQMLRVAHVSVNGVQEQTAGVEARWGTLTQWTVFERDSGMLRSEIVDGWRGTRTPAIAWPIVPASPLVATSRSLDTVNNFLQVHDLPLAIERPAESDGTREISWSDLRYCERPGPSATIECGLWFGGTFDRDGRALTQVVRVGGWVQTRPVSH